jgi:hypothetical protein
MHGPARHAHAIGLRTSLGPPSVGLLFKGRGDSLLLIGQIFANINLLRASCWRHVAGTPRALTSARPRDLESPRGLYSH